MWEKIVMFAFVNPVVVVAALAGVGVLLWLFGWMSGRKDGKLEQHEQEMNFMCVPGEHTYELVDGRGDTWSIFIKAFLQRRGGKNVS